MRKLAVLSVLVPFCQFYACSDTDSVDVPDVSIDVATDTKKSDGSTTDSSKTDASVEDTSVPDTSTTDVKSDTAADVIVTDAAVDVQVDAGGPFTVGGTVTGLLGGTSLVAQVNAAQNLAITSAGAFTFGTALPAGTAYTVTILTQPVGQTCVVTNGTGVATATVSNVAIACTPNAYTLSANVTGLLGTGLVLENAKDAVKVAANGTVAFPTAVPYGSAYSVSVTTQPSAPTQLCVAGNGVTAAAGTMGLATTVPVVCTIYKEITLAAKLVSTDVQVAIDLDNTNFNYAAGNANGDDIRFFDDKGVSLPYYIEKWNFSKDARIWVRVPTVGNNTKIYLSHGDPSRKAASSGDATFLFFDDFSGNALDAAKWETRGTPALSTVAGGVLTFQGNNNWEYIRSKTNFTAGIVEIDLTSGGVSGASMVGNTGSDNRYTFRAGIGNTAGTTFDNDLVGGNSFFDQAYPGTPFVTGVARREEIDLAIDANSNILVRQFCNRTTANCTAASRALNSSTSATFFVGFSSYSSSYPVTADRIFVRRTPASAINVTIL